MARWRKLGIIAGGGALPVRIAQTCQANGAPFFVVRLEGSADQQTAAFPSTDCGLAEAGKLIRLLKQQECDGVVLAGLVARPDFKALRPDWRGAALLPKVVAAAARGDGALLGVLVETLESEGFIVIGADEVTEELLAPAGTLSRLMPNAAHLEDIKKAAALIRAIGPFDVGQAAVVVNGHVVAVEAAEGTDAMLQRVAGLVAERQGQGHALEGVLVKRPKPGQELRVDLPTIGARTIELAHQARLAGVAVQARGALVMDRPKMVMAADQAGLFVYGFEPAEVRQA